MKSVLIVVIVFFLFCVIFFSCKKKDDIVSPPVETPGKQKDTPWPGLADSPWPMVGGNPQFTGRSSLFGPLGNTAVWSLRIPGPPSVEALTSPVLAADSTVYFVSSFEPTKWGQSSYLYAVSPNGNVKWKFRLAKDSTDNSNLTLTSPVVLRDGSIIIADWNGRVFSVSPTGILQWIFEIPAKIIASSTVTVGRDGALYFTNGDGYLYSLQSNGSLQWKIILDNGFGANGVAISNDGKTLYVTGAIKSKTLYALSTDGVLKWSYDAGLVSGVMPLIDNQGNLYIGPSFGNDTVRSGIYSLTPEGNVRWQYGNIGFWGDQPAMDSDGNIYFWEALSGTTSAITSIDYNGKLRWRNTLSHHITSAIVCDKNDNVYFDATDLVSMSKSGVVIQSFGIKAPVWTFPLIGYGNSLCVAAVGDTMNQYVKFQ